MHQQYIASRDVKFPDCKQYTKPGDVLMFNSTNNTLSIYRCNDLIGTVQFSFSGLQEFLRLGWITKPNDTKSEDKKKAAPKKEVKAAEPKKEIPAPKPKEVAVPEPKSEIEAPVAPVEAPEVSEGVIPTPTIKFRGKKSFSEERTVDTPESKSRKAKKS